MQYRGCLFYLLTAFVLITIETEVLCQEKYSVSGVVYIRDGRSDKISVTLNNSKQIKVPVDMDGNFSVLLDWNESYIFQFSKPGYVSKRIEFLTFVPDNVNKKSIYPYEIQVELFPIYPNVDYMFYKKPVAKIEYDNLKRDFDYDLDYQLTIKNKVEKAKKDYLNWKNQENINHEVSNKVNPEKSNEVASDTQKEEGKEKDPFGLPPLNTDYPEGKTVEVFNLKAKTVTRVIIKKQDIKNVCYQVKHNWGGTYYFLLVSPKNYKSISKNLFDNLTNY